MLDFHDYRLWLVGAAAALLTGIAKSGMPGLGILTVPLMAMAMPAKASVGALLPILICGDLCALRIHGRHVQWPQIARLLPGVAVGMAAAFFALGRLQDRQARPLLGALVLTMLLMESVRRRFSWDRLPHHPVFAGGVGITAGFATTLGNAAGPIMNIYLLARELPKEAFVGTAAGYFFIVNVLKLPIFAARGMITRDSLLFNLAVCPAVTAGAWIGARWVSRLSPRRFLALVFALTAAAAVRLLWPS